MFIDEQDLKQNKIQEAVKRFKQISTYKSPKQSLNEYTFITTPQINEEGDDEENPNDMMGGNQQNQQMGGGGADQNQDNMPMQGGGDNQGQDMMGGQDMGNGPMDNPNNQNPMGGDGGDMMGQEVPNQPMDDGQEGMEMGGDEPNFQDDEEDDGVETEEMEDDDEVIDVDDLTQSQEATEYKIDGVDERLTKILSVVKKFSDQLEKNEQSLEDLKREFERRNPTEEEKLNIRSQSSYPYAETPKGYWDRKVKEDPRYDIMFNNDVSPSDEQKVFKITDSDIKGLDLRTISDTLNYNYDIEKNFNF